MRISISIGLFVLVLSCTYDHLEKSVVSPCINSNLSLKYALTQPSSCGSRDGGLTLRASGGYPKYLFKVNDGGYLPDSLISNLSQGNYTVTVKDSAGCTTSQIISLNSKSSNIQITTVTTKATDCANNGTIVVTATGGKKPFKYSIDAGAAQSDNTFNGLAAKTYSISITDSTGCQASASATVVNTSPSFVNEIQPIISSNCATSGCHNGSRRPDLTSFNNISSNASAVLGAINSNMPPGGRLSAQQIGLITCWVKSGAPNN
jgi:hypothetical protein